MRTGGRSRPGSALAMCGPFVTAGSAVGMGGRSCPGRRLAPLPEARRLHHPRHAVRRARRRLRKAHVSCRSARFKSHRRIRSSCGNTASHRALISVSSAGTMFVAWLPMLQVRRVHKHTPGGARSCRPGWRPWDRSNAHFTAHLSLRRSPCRDGWRSAAAARTSACPSPDLPTPSSGHRVMWRNRRSPRTARAPLSSSASSRHLTS